MLCFVPEAWPLPAFMLPKVDLRENWGGCVHGRVKVYGSVKLRQQMKVPGVF